MSKNVILMDCNDKQLRTAFVSDGKLIEVLIDNLEETGIIGNIYSGIIKNIFPTGFVFVDIGLSKNAFIYLKDKREQALYNDDKTLKIKNGQTILVQILRDATNSKGAYASSRLSFQGRYVVAIGTDMEPLIAFSKKIDDQSEKDRLREIVKKILPFGYDVIIRTDAVNKTEQEVENDLNELMAKFKKAHEEWIYALAPSMVYNLGGPNIKAVNELFREDVSGIYVNSREVFESLKEECRLNLPLIDEKLHFYDNQVSIFQNYSVEHQLSKALVEKVWLKSGAFIVIECTEACFVIDVNTGKYTGSKSHEETALKVNLEAAEEIAYQLRLRNLNGIIIVDFIDMKEKESVIMLVKRLEDFVRKDRIPTTVVGMTELGLMQMTRKKTRNTLYESIK